MRWMVAGAAAAALFAAPVPADDTQQAAMKTMHEAMVQQAGMPATPPAMPDHSTMDPAAMHQQRMATQKHDQVHKGDAQQGPRMPSQETQHKHAVQVSRDAEQAAHQQSVMHGAKDANAVRADMANRAAMGAAMGGAASAMGQGNMDGMNAAGMMRTTNPSGGMMGGGSTMGSSGSGGGMTPGTGTGMPGTGTTSGTGSMPSGGTR